LKDLRREKRKKYPMSGKERKRFLKGVESRVGGEYCSPPSDGCTDCSGLVAEEYQKATGRWITPDSHHLYAACTPVDPASTKPGDLAFHNTGICRHGNCDSHVGVIVSDTERVDAMNWGLPIRRGPRKSEYWYQTFTHAGRLPFGDE
jgi:cell wall-associated NlpC family hydrolase